MVFLSWKAHPLLRVTVVREGMSIGEERVMGNTLQSDDTRMVECPTAKHTNDVCSSECSEFRQVYSSVHFIITTSHYQYT